MNPAWVMLLLLPVFLDAPVRARIEVDDPDHCERVREDVVQRLITHHSLERPTACTIGVKTVKGDAPVPPGRVPPAWVFAAVIPSEKTREIRVRVEVDHGKHCHRVRGVAVQLLAEADYASIVPSPCLLGAATVLSAP